MSVEAPTKAVSRRRKPAGKAACGSSSPDTKELILQVAERMFAERGFASVSIRDLTAEAGVNIASINYYFGSKDKLLYELFKRRTNEMTDARLAGLHEAQARSGGAPSVRDIMRALVAPGIEWRDPNSPHRHAFRFLSRARTEGTPQIKKVIDTRLGALEEFRDALLKAAPGATIEEVVWGLHFALSTMHHVGVERSRIQALSMGACDGRDVRELIERLVTYTAAGFTESVKAASSAHGG
jgi:AcrR family transcriptional regulator